MNKKKKIIIIGDGEFAEIAYEYFTHDSEYEVVAFSVEKEYLKKSSLFGLPVIDFQDIEKMFSPNEYEVFVAITYTKLNRVRARLYLESKKKGYRLATYISSKAFVWHNVVLGDNCFIFENNVIQYHTKIENNVILWSGNHIGHRARIEDNCFISSHVVISGYCHIGANCFLGVNSTFADRVIVGDDCLIGAGSVVIKNVERDTICKGNPAMPSKVTSLEYFGIKNE